MPYDIPPSHGPCRQTEAARAGDRVLLYARGLDLDPVSAVELALESMRRAGFAHCDEKPGGPALHKVMEEFRRLLDGRQGRLCVTDPQGETLTSMPPLNRRPMLPEEMDRSPLKRALKSLGALLGPTSRKPS